MTDIKPGDRVNVTITGVFAKREDDGFLRINVGPETAVIDHGTLGKPSLFSRVCWRAGYPDRSQFRRYGRCWLRIGPYVVGDVHAWDTSGAP